MHKFAFLMAEASEDYHTYRPLCFGYLASYLRKHVPEVEVAVFQDLDDLLDYRPDLAGFSATSTNFNLACRLAGRVKESLGIPTLIGGVHITVLPHRLPEVFDVGVLGEGERTMVDLARLYLAEKRLDPAGLAAVNGITYGDGDGQTVRTAPRELIAPLDEIPRPDRRIIGHEGTRAYMFTSRGCPYDCRFCSSQRHWGRYRTFSPEYVLAEIEEIVERFGPKEIHFFDDLFVANRKRLNRIADGIVERGWQKDIAFSCALRANVVDEELMETLKRMEIRRVTFGAESASDEILRYLKGDNVTAEMNQRAVDLCHRYEIRVGPSFIKGAPDETGEDLLATYDFILRNIRAKKIDYFEIHNLTPFPGTPIWDHARERGLVSEEMDWDELKVPWENLYLNERIPKSSFYFFETLTKKGQEMLGIFDRRLVGIADATAFLDGFTADRAAWLAEGVETLRRDRFLDVLHVVDLHTGDGDRRDRRAALAEAGVPVADLAACENLATGPREGDIIAYFRIEPSFDAEKIYAAAWRHFEAGADLTRFAETKYFTPTDDFERGVFVFSSRAFPPAYRAYARAAADGSPVPDLTETYLNGPYAVEIYRPDEDPFVEAGGAARLFRQRLSADFKLDRMNPEQRARRLGIIEERIVQKEKDLPKLERRRRKLARSGLGRRIRASDSAFLKGLVKFLLYRD